MKETIKVNRNNPQLVVIDDITFAQASCWFGTMPYKDLKMSLMKPVSGLGITPAGPGEKLPVFVWICGGGWITMEKNAHLPWLTYFAERGWAVASVEYRMSTAAPMPAQLQDIKAAIRYLRAHADRFGIDPDRIAVGGESAGGYLAAMTGACSTTASIPARNAWTKAMTDTPLDAGEFLSESSAVKAVIDFYGPTEFDTTRRLTSRDVPGPMDNLLGYTPSIAPEAAMKMSPLSYITKDSPAFFIAHGSKDIMVPLAQSENLYELLESRSVRNEFYIIEGAPHFGPEFYQESFAEKVLSFLNETV